MQLRTSIVLMLAGIAAASALATWSIQRAAILPSFEGLERLEAERNLQRALDGLGRELERLQSAADELSWTSVSDGALYSSEPARAWDLALRLDCDGCVLTGDCRDPDEPERPLALARFMAASWSSRSPLLANAAGAAGIAVTERGPLLVCSRPARGTEAGWIVLGRFLTERRLNELAEQVQVALEVLSVAEIAPGDAAHALIQGARSSGQRIEEVGEEARCLSAFVRDLDGGEGVLLRTTATRSITRQGKDATNFALASIAVATLLLLLVVLLLLRKLIVDPLARLTAHAVRVGESEDLSVRLGSERRDEIGVLTRALDRMVASLAASRAQWIEAARLGGMSEVATSVLHDVGNALNSVNVAAASIRGRIDGESWRDIERAASLLAAHAEDLAEFITEDEKGRHLPDFLDALLAELARERAGLVRELRTLSDGLEHIQALIGSQQDLAGRRDVVETVTLAVEFERALALSHAERGGVTILREYEEVESLPLEKHRLLEILINLLRNARDAVEQQPAGSRRIRLCIERRAERVRFVVADNGFGIESADLDRIFRHGFTTKPEGHGFGLHASANLARRMGGRLFAESAGRGRGASFVLDLPLHARQPAEALA